MTIEQAVHRLTGELADWYRIDAGHLRIGDRADIVDHRSRAARRSLDEYAEEPVEQYGGLSRMVNRNDDTVQAVFVGGRAVFLDGEADRPRRRAAHRPVPAGRAQGAGPHDQEAELSSVS